MTSKEVLAEALLAASDTGARVSRPSGLDFDTAFAVQRRLLELRLERGERRVGSKLGFTNLAKQKELGLDRPAYGPLTDVHQLESGGFLASSAVCAPKLEAELAVRLGKRLSGPVSQEEAFASIDAVAPALEVADSRYEPGPFDLAQIIADGSNACRFVLGGWRKPPAGLDALTVRFRIDGKITGEGTTDAILGSPVNAVIAASEIAGRIGEALEPGWVLMAGAVLVIQPMPVGITVGVEIDGFEPAELTII